MRGGGGKKGKEVACRYDHRCGGLTPESPDSARLLTESVHNYFGYRSDLNLREFHRLMREGWTSLLIGTAFLGICVTIGRAVAPHLGR